MTVDVDCDQPGFYSRLRPDTTDGITSEGEDRNRRLAEGEYAVAQIKLPAAKPPDLTMEEIAAVTATAEDRTAPETDLLDLAIAEATATSATESEPTMGTQPSPPASSAAPPMSPATSTIATPELHMSSGKYYGS